jgi:mono/diheme cytochrome c family protein
MFVTRIRSAVLAGLMVALLGAGTGLLLTGGLGGPQAQAKGPADDPAALVKRGDYLVNQVARCGDCHTPRDAKGKLDNTRLLQGGPVPYTPRFKGEEWEDHSPDITLSGKAGKWSEAKMVKYLSGKGEKSDPPMPNYQLTEEDARAITAYLHSLPGKQGGDKKKGDRREKDDD